MELLSFLYLTTSAIIVVSYITQTHKLLIDKTDSSSISILSWAIWSYSSIISLLYTSLVNGDTLLIISASIATLGCTSTLLLVIFNRYIKKRYLNAANYSFIDIIFMRHILATEDL